MKRVNRRQFIGQTAMGLGSAIVLSRLPIFGNIHSTSSITKHPIGFQSFPIRDILVKDFPGTLKMMASLGYQTVEMCSPPGYKGAGFAPLVDMKAKEMRRIINDAGLT